MTLKERAIKFLKDRKAKIDGGGINTIPSPFKRFSDDFIGIEQGKYYLVTGQTKAAKSQITGFLFMYNTLLYAFYHPDKIRLKIFYYALEETPENILYRFMSYYLYIKSNFTIEVSPEDLKSSKPNKPIDENILALLETEEYSKIFDYFEEHVEFPTSRNPTGIYRDVKSFAESNGTVHTKSQTVRDEWGEEKTITGFDYYTPNDPDLYTLVIVDHISLVSQEKIFDTKQVMTLKQAIDKLSEYCVILRNRYNVTPIVVQQQSVESESNDSFKLGRIRPTIGNLSDSKYVAKDIDIMLGIFSPYRFELRDYQGYNITILKDNFRLLEVIVNRGGCPGGTIGLFFNGKCNYFKELPRPGDIELENVYKAIRENKNGKVLFIKTNRINNQESANTSIFATLKQKLNKWQQKKLSFLMAGK